MPVLERFYMLPKRANVGNLDVNLRVTTDAVHDLFGRGQHKVNRLAIALDNGIFRRFHRGSESENFLIERERLFHVGHC